MKKRFADETTEVIVGVETVADRRADRYQDDDVARRAYEIWQRRGGGSGHDLEDWLEAERQLQGPKRV